MALQDSLPAGYAPAHGVAAHRARSRRRGPFPTILALHGWGASAHDLLGLAPFLHGGQALVVCPQGPVGLRDRSRATLGHGWFPIARGRPPGSGASSRAARRCCARFLDQVLEPLSREPRKLVLLGFSQGGVMAYDLVLRDPERFAGLVALSSWLPPELVASPARRPELAQLPVFVAHGSQDPMIPVASARPRATPAPARRRRPTASTRWATRSGPRLLRDLVEWLESKVLSPIQLV